MRSSSVGGSKPSSAKPWTVILRLRAPSILLAMLLAAPVVTAESPTAVVAWGIRNDATFVPTGLSNVVAISASLFDNLALNHDGTVVGWGESLASRSPTIATLTDVTAI